MKTLFLYSALLLCAVSAAAQNFNVAPALESHVEYLCSEALAGRKAGTQGEKDAAAYVYDSFKKSGLTMLTDENGQDFKIQEKDGEISSCNIVGLVEGSDSTLRNEFIVIGANFDHLGTNQVSVNGKAVTQFYPGANANASGTAILLELAKMVNTHSYMFGRTVIFVGFGASEKGMAGSWYFANRAFSQIDDVRAMINLNMLGCGEKGNPFSIFSQMPLRYLTELLDKTAEEPVVLVPAGSPKEITPSDHLPFYDKGIPIISFSNGMTKEYHTPKDKPYLIDYQAMEMECNYIFHFLKVISNAETLPEVKAPSFNVPEESGTDDKIHSPSECDSRPEFYHNNEKHFLETWVYKYLKYPRRALEAGIQGKVLVGFIVEKNGEVKEVEVVSGVDEDLDAEAVRVISVSPKWQAGRIKGEKVRTRIVVPVEFRLSTSKPKIGIKK